MANPSWVPRVNITRVVAVTPVITAGAYNAGDQLGSIMAIPDVIRQDTQSIVNKIGDNELVSVTILDKAKQDAEMDVWFFNQLPTLVSADHAAFNISDSELVAKCIGVVSLGVTYSDSVSNSVTTSVTLNLPMQVPGTSATPTSVFAVAVNRGTPTYTSTSDLQFQFGFFVD